MPDKQEFEDPVEPEQFERDVFGAPDKIEIPERYDPNADVDDSWPIDSEGDEEREQRSERYRQLLLKQSLANLSQEEAASLASRSNNDLHSAIQQESVERHRLLRLSQSLAQQAKNASLHQAERLRRNSVRQSGGNYLYELPPSGPPPPPPQQVQNDSDGNHDEPNSQSSPDTLWMEYGNREMAIDVC